jgi:regulatory protein
MSEMNEKLTLNEARLKLEHYCSYQERCHQEVVQKSYDLGMKYNEVDAVVVHLIQNNFLNEERFARTFARGKHRIKAWGKIRIVNELKQRQVSAPNIKCALTEIPEEEYRETLDRIAEKHWESITEKNSQKKKKKFCDYLLRKGWESNLVYEKLKQFERSSTSPD